MLQQIKNNSGLLFYLLLLTGIFVCFEISVFVKGNELYLGDYKFIAGHLSIPFRKVLPGILYFFFVQILLHVSFIFIIWILAYFIGVALRLKNASVEKLGILLWVIGLILILLANQYLYPNSKFSSITKQMIPEKIFLYVWYFFICAIFLFVVLASYGFLRKIKSIKIVIGLLLCLWGSIFFINRPATVKDAATTARPNIILVGVDALRPDFLGFFGGSSLISPYLDKFLEQATVFSDALTPIARTYPAWISIFTGEFPKKNGIRTDLSPEKIANLDQSLPKILQKNGYQTIFAMDDVRYSNIDNDLGFDQIISPPMGFNDFLIGSLNDFPLSNLIVNTFLGKFFLPYNYANRAAYITYQPDSFIHLLNSAIPKSREKPIFLAVHFCLAHYPYIWASLPASKKYIFNYYSAVKRVDQQVHDFLVMLKKNKLMERSIVILLSDHGEALGLPGDRVTHKDLFFGAQSSIPHFYPEQGAKVDRSAGHGTDVLGLSQYHIVLACRFFGLERQIPHIVTGQTSLLDIKPTLLDYLKLPFSSNSLRRFISENNIHRSDNHFFIETDFSPDAVRAVHPEMRKVLLQGLNYFRVNTHTSRIMVKKSMLDLIISSKQYAVIDGVWILALYPKDDKSMVPILVNLASGVWTDDLSSVFAVSAPVQSMLHALRLFFDNEIKNIS